MEVTIASTMQEDKEAGTNSDTLVNHMEETHMRDLYRRAVVECVTHEGKDGFVDHFRRLWIISPSPDGQMSYTCIDVEKGTRILANPLTVSTEPLRMYIPSLKQHRDFNTAAPYVLDNTQPNRYLVDWLDVNHARDTSSNTKFIVMATDAWVAAVSRYIRMVRRSLEDNPPNPRANTVHGVWKITDNAGGVHGAAALSVPCLNVPGMIFMFEGRLPDIGERERMQRIVNGTPGMRPGIGEAEKLVTDVFARLAAYGVFPMRFNRWAMEHGSAQLYCAHSKRHHSTMLAVEGVFVNDRMDSELKSTYVGGPSIREFYALKSPEKSAP